MRQVGNEILDDSHIGERIDRCRRANLGNKSRAGQPVGAVHVHGAGAADAFPARAAECKRRIHLVLDPEQRIENHRSAIVEVDVESIEAGVRVEIGIVAIDLSDRRSNANRTASLSNPSLFPGKREFRRRDKLRKNAPETELRCRRDRSPKRMPANCGPFSSVQEISLRAGVRGGAGRTRTCKQEIMSVPFGRRFKP